MRFPGLLLLVLFAACSLLPDRVYTEVAHAPLADLHEDLGDFSPYEFTVGLEWALQPTDVIILGQRDAHPWDFASSLGIYDGQTPHVPSPLLVADDALLERLAILAGRVDEGAADIEVLRETSDSVMEEWDTINRTLLGGGGLGGLILLILGGRAFLRSRQTTTKES